WRRGSRSSTRCGGSREEGTQRPQRPQKLSVLSGLRGLRVQKSMGLITNYNLRSMTVRKGTAAMTAGGIAMVVAVFVMTLAIAQGFNATLVSSGSPGNAIVLRKSVTSETTSAVLRPDVPLIESLP